MVESTSFSDYLTILDVDVSTHRLGSVRMDVPGDGRIVVLFSGYTVFFGDGRTVSVGIGDDVTTLDVAQSLGRHDGSGRLRFYEPFSVVATYPVTAGQVELYALAQGNDVFADVQVNVTPTDLTAIFVPTTGS
jgi:hypothetical protein